jgi:hypothetical protein
MLRPVWRASWISWSMRPPVSIEQREEENGAHPRQRIEVRGD